MCAPVCRTAASAFAMFGRFIPSGNLSVDGPNSASAQS